MNLFPSQADNLKFVKLDLGHHHYGVRPILLPTFFYAGQTRKAVDQGGILKRLRMQGICVLGRKNNRLLLESKVTSALSPPQLKVHWVCIVAVKSDSLLLE
jgi:hypothetical protein